MIYTFYIKAGNPRTRNPQSAYASTRASEPASKPASTCLVLQSNFIKKIMTKSVHTFCVHMERRYVEVGIRIQMQITDCAYMEFRPKQQSFYCTPACVYGLRIAHKWMTCEKQDSLSFTRNKSNQKLQTSSQIHKLVKFARFKI